MAKKEPEIIQGKKVYDPRLDPAALEPLAQADGEPLPALVTYLTADASAEFGPKGRFVDLDPEDAKDAVKAGLLVLPTAEQLSLRRI